MRDICDYTSKYVHEPFEETMVKIRKRTVIAQCLKYIHKSILEVGCGISPLFKDFCDFDCMAIIEPSEEFSIQAQKTAEKSDIAAEIIVYNAFLENIYEKIKEERKQFDIIVASSLLHEVEDPAKFLESIRELCSKDTVVHMNVPNAVSMHRLIALECGIIADVHEKSKQQIFMQRQRTFDMQQLVEQVENAGFQVQDSGSYFIKPFTHSQMQKCLEDGIIDERVLEGLEGLTKYFPDAGAEIYVNVKRKDRNYG